MTPDIALIFWTFVLSLAITYAWWTQFRVWILRQDLFEIRDGLWDAMQRSGQLDHPSHRKCRQRINAVIRIGSLMSLLTLCSLLVDGVHSTAELDDEEELPEVVAAENAMLAKVVNYFLYQSITGLILNGVARIFRLFSALQRQLNEWVRRAVDSREINLLSSNC